jgi:hypothetical protein
MIMLGVCASIHQWGQGGHEGPPCSVFVITVLSAFAKWCISIR